MRLLASLALPAFLLALALGACGPVNRGVEAVNQPVVHRTDYVIDLGAGGLDGLEPGEATRLSQWFDTLRLGYGDKVAIDDPAHAGGGAARETVAALVARYGLLLAEGVPVTQGAIAPAGVRIVVSRSQADVPGCPNWRRSADPEFAASSMSNYGCATNSNLAAMVADPQDLVRGVTDGGAGVDPRVTARAMKAYRDAPTTGGANELKHESTSKGGGQ